MRILYTIVALLALATLVFGQGPVSGQLKFDIEGFNKKFELVEWLVEYDNVAWKTTDVVMALPKADLSRLGQEWFCFQDSKKVWHAMYGKLTGATYDPVVHLEMDANQKIVRTEAKIDQEFLNRHALALKTGRDKLTTSIPSGSPRFNQFIRQNSDKTFSVWLLPAFQPNRMAVFGGEAIYTIDATGTKIIRDDSYFQKEFRGFLSEPPREISINYSEQEKPSLGAIFFVWYYKAYFTQIFIENAKTTTTAIKAGDRYIWVHVEKDDPANPADKDEPARPRLERKKPGGN